MMRVLAYALLAVAALLLQTVLLPPLFPGGVKPDLVLLLTIWIGLRETPWRAGLIVYVLGWLYDVHAGTFPGLHGFVLLTVCLTVSGMATRLNTESLPLVWCLVGGGTLLQGSLVMFAVEFFADTGPFWMVMLQVLPVQLLLNVVGAWLIYRLAMRFLREPLPLPAGQLPPPRRRHET
jgi:rod shape-determining protein MreD